MSKLSMLIGGVLMMGTTLVAATPQPKSPVFQPQPTTSSTVPSWLPEQQTTACNLFCIQGYYCCVKHNTPTCIPNADKC